MFWGWKFIFQQPRSRNRNLSPFPLVLGLYNSVTFALLLVFAYCVGAIPFGLLLGRLFADVDVRAHGSGNIGATNVNRVLGRKLGAATLGCDLLKGLFVVLLAKWLLPDDTVRHSWVALAAFVGHCFPIYLNFNGGKGVATTFGVLLPISAKTAFLAFFVWLFAARLSRISALGALSAAAVIPFSIFYFTRDVQIFLIFLIMMLVLVYRHKENIRRLKAGVEK